MAKLSETRSEIMRPKTVLYSTSGKDLTYSPDKDGSTYSLRHKQSRSELSELDINVADYVRYSSRENTAKSLMNLIKQLKATVRDQTTNSEETSDEKSDKTPSAESRLSSCSGETGFAKRRRAPVVNLSSCKIRIVKEVVRKLGIKETHGITRDWDVFWSSNPISIIKCKLFMKHQRTNHFPESSRPLLKNNLAKYLTHMSLRHPKHYDFFPETWCLPEEFSCLRRYAHRHPSDWFIVKPHNCCSGHGIFITKDLSQVANCGRMVCQVYIQRPLLIDNFKFDLRIYVLVTSCKPLRIFVYNEGFARLGTEMYETPNRHNERKRRMHLTNYCVNKNSPNCIVDDEKGTLRRFSTFCKWLTARGIDTKNVMDSVDDIIIKTTITIAPILSHYYYSSFPDHVDSNACFQIFGFDVMFDVNLKPYLLEVNADPSLYADIKMERQVKEELIRDTFNILNITGKTKQRTVKKTSVGEKLMDDRKLTLSRIEWEDSHMGNYRKLYPNPDNKKYEEFLKSAERIARSI